MRPPRLWPARLAVREGAATARFGRWTSMLYIVAVAWLGAAPGALDALDVTALQTAEQGWIDAGAFTFRVFGAKRGEQTLPVPGRACEALNAVTGVDAAFATATDPGSARFAHLPGGRFSVVHTSPSAEAFLGVADEPTGAVVLTTALAERTGLYEGDAVTVQMLDGIGAPRASPDASRDVVVAVALRQDLGADVDGALLVPGPAPERADTCWVRSDAQHAEAVSGLLPTALAWDGSPARASTVLATQDFRIDFSRAFETRTLRWAWVATGGSAALLWVLVQWFRRGQTAIYAAFGMRARARAIMQATEWALLAGAGTVWGVALGWVGAVALGAAPGTALVRVVAHCALTVAAAGIVAVVAGFRPTGTIVDALKDR